MTIGIIGLGRICELKFLGSDIGALILFVSLGELRFLLVSLFNNDRD